MLNPRNIICCKASRVTDMQVVYQRRQFLPGGTIGSLPAESVLLLEQGPESGGIAPVVGELKRQYMDRCTERGYPLACNPATGNDNSCGNSESSSTYQICESSCNSGIRRCKKGESADYLLYCSRRSDNIQSKSFANNSLPGLVIIWVKSDNSGLRVSCSRVVKAGVIKTLSTT